MASITECLLQIQKLTSQNLSILQAINDSFLSKQSHLTVQIGDSTYAMPSFIYLENKINALQESFNNVVNAPTTGEAYFNFTGDSRSIEVRGYTHTPNRLVLDNVTNFGVLNNDVLKDFLTPMPYVKFNLKELPNDITSVVVKKVIPKNENLKSIFTGQLSEQDASAQYNWADVYKNLYTYKEDVDYIMYDKIYKLPIRKNIGSGSYVIEKIISDNIDENLDEYVTLKIRADVDENLYMSKLQYKLFDDTISKNLNVGDQLVTHDDSAKMEIVEIAQNSNTLKVKILYGEYLNLVPSTGSEISDLSVIKFYSPIDFDDDKYINIPLEEDQYVWIGISALNERMNIQSPWGTGLILNTYNLALESNENVKFYDYYKENVQNIGDVLYEITAMSDNSISVFNEQDFSSLINAVPVIDSNNIQVIQINKHLNDSETVKNIRSLYSQKQKYNTELTEIQTKINEINEKLASISFDDTSNMRSLYTSQLSEYNTKKNELVTSLTKIINEISLSANNSDIPIENAKYHIRGFFDYENFANNLTNVSADIKNHIIGISVQYRYKTIDKIQGNAETIGEKFLFSDWNIMNGFLNQKYPEYNSGYKFKYPEDNSNKNEPSFNQIDIPISQGETVDIRLKVIYDYGYPFIQTCSAWSEIINVQFPTEYLKNVQILDIIQENNNDIETNRFNNILQENGISSHINDSITDQDLVYYHKPENISSGFYTEERRIIPLKDKLLELNNSVIQLQDEILGTTAESISVNIVNGDVSNKILPNQSNNINVESYNEFVNQTGVSSEGTYIYENGIVSTVLNILLTNTSQHSVKIYSLFPGSRDKNINDLVNAKYNKSDYCSGETEGVYIRYEDGSGSQEEKLQSANQFITFRINDPYTATPYYSNDSTEEIVKTDNQLNLLGTDYNALEVSDSYGAIMYPKLSEKNGLCMDNDTTHTYITLSPNEEIIIPIIFGYKLNDEVSSISKTMSFDIRTSLYSDPINYTFTIIAKLSNTIQDKIITTNRKFNLNNKYNTTVVK